MFSLILNSIKHSIKTHTSKLLKEIRESEAYIRSDIAEIRKEMQDIKNDLQTTKNKYR